MPASLTCPRGHSFELPQDGATLPERGPVACPVCGVSFLPLPETLAFPPAGDGTGPGVCSPLGDGPGGDGPPGYEVLSLLGRGGMGVVFKARQVALNRLVALKMVRGADRATPQELARFQVEAEALASLQHPHIVQIHEVGTHRGWPYFSLELVEGGDLATRLNGKPQPPREAARLVEALARAVHAAHSRGIVHRDLKPSNVLLTPDGQPKVTDFGLAKRLEAPAQDSTLPGMILGTPAYMAPEQAAGTPGAVGPAADVYALGAILYEMLAGRPPFLASSLLRALEQVRTLDPAPPSAWQARLPRDLEVICLKCLEKEPAKRYAGAGEMADDLARFLAGEPIRARPAGRAERLLKWARRRPAAALLVAVALAGLLAGGAGALWHHLRLRAERDRAERHFQTAWRAVDEMLPEVAVEQLAVDPRLQEGRRLLLERALALYRELFADRPDDPALRRQMALAAKRVADLHRLLGQHEQAEENYREAVDLLGPLADDSPGEPALRRALAETFTFRGESLRLLSRLEEAESSYRRARAIQEELVASGGDPDDAKDLARSYKNLGIVLNLKGEHAGARRHLEEARARLDALARRHPGRAPYRQHLARVYLNLATVVRHTDGFEAARSASERAIALLEGLAREHPRAADYRHELAVCHNNLGNLFSRAGRPAEARPRHERARDLFARLARDYPNIPVYRSELANTLNSLGSALARDGRHDEARAAWEAAAERLDQLVGEFPELPAYRGDRGLTGVSLGALARLRGDLPRARRHLVASVADLGAVLKVNPDHPDYLPAGVTAYQRLADVLVALGEHDDARARAAQLPRELPRGGCGYFLSACFLARCVESAEKAVPAPEGGAEPYVRQARALLEEARRRGGPEALRRLRSAGEELAPLRRRADFAGLLAGPAAP